MTGKGAIACTDPLNAGLFGRYDRIANGLIEEADVLLVVGCKLGEIATKRFTIPKRGKTLIHLDIVAEEFGRTYQPTVTLWADVREGIRDLAAALSGDAKKLAAQRTDYCASVAKRMATWREGV
jgi:acetolactate synthase-1/2/3 large subunit